MIDEFLFVLQKIGTWGVLLLFVQIIGKLLIIKERNGYYFNFNIKEGDLFSKQKIKHSIIPIVLISLSFIISFLIEPMLNNPILSLMKHFKWTIILFDIGIFLLLYISIYFFNMKKKWNKKIITMLSISILFILISSYVNVHNMIDDFQSNSTDYDINIIIKAKGKWYGQIVTDFSVKNISGDGDFNTGVEDSQIVVVTVEKMDHDNGIIEIFIKRDGKILDYQTSETNVCTASAILPEITK